jgi:hypothetical protein
MATMWSKSGEINPANLFPSLASLVEAYDLEAGETVYTCQVVIGYEVKNIRARFLTEADLRDLDRIY